MSISKDEKFMELLDIYGQNYYIDEGFDDSLSMMYKEKFMQCREQLIDYIDEYSEKQYEEGIESEKDNRRCYG